MRSLYIFFVNIFKILLVAGVVILLLGGFVGLISDKFDLGCPQNVVHRLCMGGALLIALSLTQFTLTALPLRIARDFLAHPFPYYLLAFLAFIVFIVALCHRDKK